MYVCAYGSSKLIKYSNNIIFFILFFFSSNDAIRESPIRDYTKKKNPTTTTNKQKKHLRKEFKKVTASFSCGKHKITAHIKFV